MSEVAKMYVVEVDGRTFGGWDTVKFHVPLGWNAYHEISSNPSGDAAKRLAMRLRPEIEEFHRVHIYEKR